MIRTKLGKLWPKLAERLPTIVSHVQLIMIGLYGSAGAYERTLAFLRNRLYQALASAAAALIAGLVLRSGWLTLTGLIVAALIPLLGIKELDSRLLRKRRAIVLELPDILGKLTLLVNAGETIQQALMRCVNQYERDDASPLYEALKPLAHELGNNESLPRALERFGKRCGTPETSQFMTTVLMHYRRGGEEFVAALQELSRQLWEKRKALAKTLGEEASSKLAFPMVVIFLAVMVIVACPALLWMNE